MRLLRRFHDLGQHPAHVLGMEEEDRRAVRPDPRVPKDAHAFAVVECPRRLDVRNLEAEVVLPALGIALEELDDRQVRAQRLDQLDLAVGRVDEADADTLRRQVERLPHHLRPHPLAV